MYPWLFLKIFINPYRIFLFHKQQPWKPGGGDEIYAARNICSKLGVQFPAFLAACCCPLDCSQSGAWLAHNVHGAAGSAEDKGNVKNCLDLDQKVVIITKIMAIIGWM
ncbi:hypothetical protein Vretifemale_15051 [Volvox reticuliferus]|uniref:Uncharacterized protein n=1 Tax=Volvox reticuliferus TaxID=1737510 RepID=A0A8J4CR19_9CHLO|nr:hypothetical protein Vretifemale_15051 [Volvox reticuliferus]